jgi:hypothetical protein
MNQDEARSVLQVEGDAKIREVLQSLVSKHSEMVRVDDFTDLEKLIKAKNTMLRPWVENEMKTRRYFKIPDHAPFSNICPACKGAGEMYKFFRTTKGIKCNICLGEKEVWLACRDCDGTTMYRKKPDSKPIICRTCRRYYENETDPAKIAKIKGKVPFRCTKCRGTGEKPIVIRSHEIEDTTSCKKCGGLGFIPPKRKKKNHPPKKIKIAEPANPVLTQDIYNKLQEPPPEKPTEEMIEPEKTEDIICECSYDSVQDKVDEDDPIDIEKIGEGSFQKKQIPPAE